MKLTKGRLIGGGAASAVTVFLFVTGVAALMEWLGRARLEGGSLIAASFMLLFVFSAAVCATLVFGWPIMLWIQNSRREGLLLLGSTLVSLLLLTALSFVLLLTL